MDQAPAPALTLEEMTAFLDEVFPELNQNGRSIVIEAVGFQSARLRLLYDPRHLRPGGTISGPAMMLLADLALYVAVLSVLGRVPLAVTTQFSINFLQKPDKTDLVAECRLLKAGKRLLVGEVSIFSAGSTRLVAHASGTYSAPITVK
jgi:uncharacterized protein (TIGR00369 family)